MAAHSEEEAREHLRKHFYHLWKALREGEEDPDLLWKGIHAPYGSQEWRRLIFYEQALRVLEVSRDG